MAGSSGDKSNTQVFGLKAPKTGEPLAEQYGHEGMRSRLLRMSTPTTKKDMVNSILSDVKKGRRTF